LATPMIMPAPKLPSASGDTGQRVTPARRDARRAPGGPRDE
jgi:hypothetical protein